MITRSGRVAGKVLLCLAIVYAALVGIGLLLTRVADDSWFGRAEDHVNTWFAEHRTQPLNDLTWVLSGLGNTAAIVGVTAVLAVVLRLAFKRWRESVFLVVAVAGQALVFFFVQLTITRQRPDVVRLDSSPPTSSFPSGHTGAATALYASSALLVWWYVQRRWVRYLAVAALVAVPLLVAVSRLYRGMHHPTDALMAILNGLACVAISAWFVLNRRGWGALMDAGPAPDLDGESALNRAAFVVNPTKITNADTLRQHAEALMAQAGWASPLWLETTPDDPGVGMSAQAADEGCDVVFACGGDGTVMAAATALAGRDVVMAIVPLGTGNLLARNLNLPLDDLDAALRIGVHGTIRHIDVGAIEDKRFVVMAGLGFDAAIMRDAPERLKRTVGWPAYVVSAVRHLRGRRISVRITIDDGEPIERRVRTVLVGNVGKLQGGLLLLPDARVDDGVLDVAVLAPRNALDWARLAGRVVGRRDVPDRRMERFRGTHVVIDAGQPQPRQLDGDLIEDGPLMDIRVEPAALAVRVPR